MINRGSRIEIQRAIQKVWKRSHVDVVYDDAMITINIPWQLNPIRHSEWTNEHVPVGVVTFRFWKLPWWKCWFKKHQWTEHMDQLKFTS